MRPLVFTDQIVVRTDADLRAAIDAAAAREGSTPSTWIRNALASVVPAPAGIAPPRPADASRSTAAHG